MIVAGAGFYKAGVPKETNLKHLYKLLGTIIKNGSVMEIPVFQKKSDFEKIINKEIAPDTVILDLNSEKGRAFVTKKYEPLATCTRNRQSLCCHGFRTGFESQKGQKSWSTSRYR